MIFAINAKNIHKAEQAGYWQYIFELYGYLVRKFPAHEFILVADKKSLDSRKVAVWLQPYGLSKLISTTPQILLVQDSAFNQQPGYFSGYQRFYFQWFTGLFFRKAKAIIAFSAYTKKNILQHFKIPSEKINVIYGAALHDFRPRSWPEKELVKEGYSDGREYFLLYGGMQQQTHFLNTLKAFSLFKKWQHSNMKLLVAANIGTANDELCSKLQTYKYREDVVLLTQLPNEKLAHIIAAAYAILCLNEKDGDGLPILNAMQSLVPVICSNTECMIEIAGEAALYADTSDVEAIAKQMHSLYKDETVRDNLIEKGKLRAAAFSWDMAAEKYWEQIIKAVET